MKEPLTDELLQELLCAPSTDSFASSYDIKSYTLPEYLEKILTEHDLKRIDVIHRANLNETFGYQIFTGARKASRNKLLQLAFAMNMSLQECNRLLQAGGVNGLYCKIRRDAIIIFCITHGSSLSETNEELYKFGEETIC